MFDKEYSFRGSHAAKVIKMTASFDQKNNKIFARNFDVYLLAPIVGFMYGRDAPQDRENNEKTDIFPDILIREKNDLMFNYRLIILLDKDYEPDFDERFNKAFRYYGSPKAQPDEERYDSYVRGGVDILYEKIMGGAKNPDDYLKNLYDFMEEFDERYNSSVSTDSILDLCKLARS